MSKQKRETGEELEGVIVKDFGTCRGENINPRASLYAGGILKGWWG